MRSIPASADVAVQPGVLGTGGSPLSLNAVWGTDSTSVPIGSVPGFPNLQSVKDYFGDNSQEAVMAAVYFSGFDNCTRLPGKLYFAQYNQNAVAGYLRSGSFAGVALSVLTALSGTLIMAVDGRTLTTPNINLSSATSFSDVANLIQAGLQGTGATFTGTASITSDVMTVTAVANGTLKVGDVVHSGANSAAITSLGTGTGGTGTYNLATIPDAASGTVTVSGPGVTVTYSSQLSAFTVLSPTTGATSSVGYATGTLAAGVKFQAAQGAVLSVGAIAATPASFWSRVTIAQQNFISVATTFELAKADQIALAQAVAADSPQGNERFMYVGETTDVTLGAGAAPTSFPVLTENLNGRVAIFSQAPATVINPDGTEQTIGDVYGKAAAFICGIAASINWSAANGRPTFKFRKNGLLNPSVVDLTVAENLDSNGGLLANNGTCYFSGVATSNANFQYLRQGGISGQWDWIDEYVAQVYLNSQFQTALLSFLLQVNAVGYNGPGFGSIRGAMQDPIDEALNNGTIKKGVTLSGAQVQALIQATGGIDISGTLFQQGWYLQILDPGATARGNRTSPAMTFWYTDGGAVQQINLASIDIQ